MILTDILGLPVLDHDGRHLGVLTDARFVLDGAPGQLLAEARLHGILVGRHKRQVFLGYERTGENAPAVIARFLRWRARDTVLILWADIASVTHTAVTLRPNHTRYSALLPDRK
jgi:sporulation protein YlmC with PRC-barrel domain